MLYFAYGSNMDFREMRERCPSARFVAVAKLPHHGLAFTRYSATRNCGVADALPEADEAVWGVVYEIAEIDFGRLDRSVGYQPGRAAGDNAYTREQRHVFRDGRESEPLLVWLYLANREPHTPLPSSTYRGLMVDGARFWHLPVEYVKQLEQIEVV